MTTNIGSNSYDDGFCLKYQIVRVASVVRVTSVVRGILFVRKVFLPIQLNLWTLKKCFEVYFVNNWLYWTTAWKGKHQKRSAPEFDYFCNRLAAILDKSQSIASPITNQNNIPINDRFPKKIQSPIWACLILTNLHQAFSVLPSSRSNECLEDLWSLVIDKFKHYRRKKKRRKMSAR